MRRLEVKTTVELPGPRLRGLRKGDVVYAAIPDVVLLLVDTAKACDNAHAVKDLGIAFRALAEEIEKASIEEFA